MKKIFRKYKKVKQTEMKKMILSIVTAYCDLKYLPGLTIVSEETRIQDSINMHFVFSDGYPLIKYSHYNELSPTVLVHRIAGKDLSTPVVMDHDQIQREFIIELWKNLKIEL